MLDGYCDQCMWRPKEYEGFLEVTLEVLCKQVIKLEKRLVAMIHVLRKDKGREVELLGLLKCCKENENGVEHYIN